MKLLYERPLIYVAGPYTTPDPVVNTREAVLAANRLIDSGVVNAFVPHLTMLMHMIVPHDLDFWYEYDMSVLSRSDALLRIPGKSTGADKEVTFAVKNKIPVFLDEADCVRAFR